ncbi:hypothetical protein F4805DRAFT_458211 [Annulohypoxylon moriforme]|nr:hypothetical protein F4805DRAFT_458211 [Annulohypoxylon moriforme]
MPRPQDSRVPNYPKGLTVVENPFLRIFAAALGFYLQFIFLVVIFCSAYYDYEADNPRGIEFTLWFNLGITVFIVLHLKPMAAVGGIIAMGVWAQAVFLLCQLGHGWERALLDCEVLYATMQIAFWVGFWVEWFSWLFWGTVWGGPPEPYGRHELERIKWDKVADGTHLD